ncbi:TIGR03571 family LLM class oxidoreductase [Rhizosphaericola mali]|uniref:TIGR03571 family LLM class oxidoreductase n=2 Tax=Rhizosphaericola mali TaxID=2545455 RepID=A0A5P2GGP6_9BACT|nr:TIGR03571 family LLM class oxidoreductase [Rhizosphaericola mali]
MLSYPKTLVQHYGYNKLFQPNKLTFGLIAPMKGYPQSPFPDMSDKEILVKKADEVGIDAIWLRDVPFYDPNFGDTGQMYDAMVYAGWLAAMTKDIVIGTSGIVLPLRNPILLAKQALSLDNLTKGRFILGLAGGDRLAEYPAFGVNFYSRVERFQDEVNIIHKVIEENYPSYQSTFYGNLSGDLDMYPKSFSPKIPILNIGRAGQNIEWIAKNTDGWIWHGLQARGSSHILEQWRQANNHVFSPYGYGSFFELAENPDTPVQVNGGFTYGGRNSLIEYWESQRVLGISHILLNLKSSQRNPLDVLEEFGKYIVPVFK